VPYLEDILTMVKILKYLGKEISFEDHILTVKHRFSKSYCAPYRLVRTMRASFCVLGPLLAKRKKAKVSLPGGCVIGVRPVDLHLKGIEELGARITVHEGYCCASLSRPLRGKRIFLGGSFGPSVLATANVMMAAVLAQGETLIECAACEPEVVDLANFLIKIGADIQGAGSPFIRIRGKKQLAGCEHTVISDRIEAGTFIALSGATASKFILHNIQPQYLGSVFETALAMGISCQMRDVDTLAVKPPNRTKPTHITTYPYPGFPTDLQAQFMSALALAAGVSTVTERVFTERFMHISELNRMGAKIYRNGAYAVIQGVKRLEGAEIMASDLRASAALVIAGLAARGTTQVLRIYHLDRGYERLDKKLQALGAEVERVKE
jgi:UDP-N-acetylglucosamine 1-carboxyvinyltransferase